LVYWPFVLHARLQYFRNVYRMLLVELNDAIPWLPRPQGCTVQLLEHVLS
jgi:hypothetical protein